MGGTTIAGWVVGVLLVAISLQRLRDLAAMIVLPDAPAPAGAAEPRVSVVVTARNEAARIEQTVVRLLAQREIDLELIVIDDRSTDDTPRILARLAQLDTRLRTVRVDRLPDGWLGKPHACHVGAEHARGEWILFTDADVWMTERVVIRAVRAAREHAADHVCLFPGEPDASIPARATMLNFSTGLVHYAARANRDDPRSMIGIGAFNLVHSTAYHEIGGHRSLRFEVVDDLKLGGLLRRAGFRSRAFGAAGELEVHWAPTVRRMIRALEKNMFAMLDFSAVRGVVAVAGLAGTVGVSLAAPLFGGSGGVAAAVGWATSLVPSVIMSRHSGWGWLPALLSPLFSPIMVVVVANSVYRTLRQGGIRWRETFYPIGRLRERRLRL